MLADQPQVRQAMSREGARAQWCKSAAGAKPHGERAQQIYREPLAESPEYSLPGRPQWPLSGLPVRLERLGHTVTF